jgi:RNA polymerase sigma factor (sigma-70 family)
MNGNNKFNNSKDKEELKALLERAKEGSGDSLLVLKAIYTPLIEAQISKHYLPEMTLQDNADLREEAFACFCSAICNYDSSYSEVDFGLYAKICIENGLNSFLRSYNRRMKSPVVSLEKAEIQADAPNYLQSIVDKEKAAQLVNLIRGMLSDYENKVWWMYVSGMSASEITEKLKISDPRSVSNAIYRIRKKLKSVLTDKN